MIPWPLYPTTFERWAAELHLARPDISIQPLNPTEKNWQAYANAVNQSAICQSVGTPRADGFSKWEDWASAFIRSFGSSA